MKLPNMVTLKQSFDVTVIKDIEGETRKLLQESKLLDLLKDGEQVAVGVGSRGISGQVKVLKTLCEEIKKTGAQPFLFPAMGSHGGGTSRGQEQVLHSLGIHEETTGAPIRSNAQGILTGETKEGIPVYLDKNALEADRVIMVNRIKLHTKFKGPVESGIQKMLSVGIGKVQGATALHRAAVKQGFPQVIQSVAARAMEELNFFMGFAIIESPNKHVHALHILTKETIAEEEILLKKSATLMPRIPFKEFDLLIVDEIGKDISGTGMDTNVTGRNRDILGDFCMEPRVQRIFVRDLTAKTQGNANGIGFADFTTKRLVDAMDIKKTYTNSLAAMSPEKAAIPVYFETDKEAITAALESIGLADGSDARIVRIKNTSELAAMEISDSLVPHIQASPGVTTDIPGRPTAMAFDPHNNLL